MVKGLMKLQFFSCFNTHLATNKYLTAVSLWNSSKHYHSNGSNFAIGVIGYIDVIYPKESFAEIWQILPGKSYIKIQFLPHREQSLSIIEIIGLMLGRESQEMHNTRTPSGQTVEFLNAKPCGSYS